MVAGPVSCSSQGIKDQAARRLLRVHLVELAHAILLARPAAGGAKEALEDLAYVHAGGNAQGVEADVDRRAVRQVGHVAVVHDVGDDALVAMPPRELVADLHAARQGDQDTHGQHPPRGSVGAPRDLFADANVHDAAPGVLRRKLGAASHLVVADPLDNGEESITRFDPSPLAHYPVLQVGRGRVVFVLKPLDRLALLKRLVHLMQVHGSEDVLADEALGYHDGVLVVVTLPRNVCHHDVLAEGHLATGNASALTQHLADADAVPGAHRAAVVAQCVLL
mmetsp:Transcript_13282/g.41963  ORF Transcript_13282/g.41963 Transcript_13282/m.41963 type:complete len:279 (+) Transcript_13282:534-1370(+)